MNGLESPRLVANAIADIDTQISAGLEPREIMKALAGAARRLTAADLIWILLPDSDGALRPFILEGNCSEISDGLVVPRGYGTAGLVIETGRTVRIGDYRTASNFLHNPALDQVADTEDLGAVVVAPIRRGRRTSGVLGLGVRHPRTMASGAASIASRLANKAAVVYGLHLAFTRAQEAQAETESLLVATALLGTRTQTQVERVLARLLAETTTLLHAERASYVVAQGDRMVALMTQDQDRLEEPKIGAPLNASIVGLVWQRNQPYRWNGRAEVQNSDHETDFRYGLQTQLAVPLRGLDGEPIGAIWVVNSRRLDGFSDRDERLLTAISEYGSVVLRRAQSHTARQAAEQEASQQKGAVGALLRAAERLNAAAEPEAVLLNLVEAASDALPVGLAAVFLPDEEYAPCRYCRIGGTWHTGAGRIALEGSVIGWVLENARPFRTDDLQHEALAHWTISPSYRPQSALSVPVTALDGTVRAVLTVYDREGQPFSVGDLHLLEGICHHAAIALQRAELTVELRRTTRSLTLLEERERVAMDLHDGAIQSLYSVMLNLGTQARTLDGPSSQLRAGLQHAIEQLSGVIEEIRTYISGLWAQELGARGLPAGLQALADDLGADGRVEAALEFDGEMRDTLPPDLVANALQVAREAVSNVIRHAEASTVTIRVGPLDGRLALTIRDDGRGFDPAEPEDRDGQGLRNMAERARRLGGTLTVASTLGSGTEVHMELPLETSGADRG